MAVSLDDEGVVAGFARLEFLPEFDGINLLVFKVDRRHRGGEDADNQGVALRGEQERRVGNSNLNSGLEKKRCAKNYKKNKGKNHIQRGCDKQECRVRRWGARYFHCLSGGADGVSRISSNSMAARSMSWMTSLTRDVR